MPNICFINQLQYRFDSFNHYVNGIFNMIKKMRINHVKFCLITGKPIMMGFELKSAKEQTTQV